MQDLPRQSRSTLLAFPSALSIAPHLNRRSGEPLCDARAVLRRILPGLQAQARGVEVRLWLPRHVPPLPLPGETLERITANLICHARVIALHRETEAAPPPAAILWVVLLARDGAARLTVEAEATGLSSSRTKAALFPAPAPGRRPGGWEFLTAQGLIVESGGRLLVRPRRCGGGVFTVTWPLAGDAAASCTAGGAVRFSDEAVAAC